MTAFAWWTALFTALVLAGLLVLHWPSGLTAIAIAIILGSDQ